MLWDSLVLVFSASVLCSFTLLGCLLTLIAPLHPSILRGGTTKSKQLIDLLFKLAFIAVMLGPSALFLDSKWGTWCFRVLFMAYVVAFVDGSELNGNWRQSERFIRMGMGWFFRRLCKFLALEVVFSGPGTFDRGPYLFGVHPHGILPFGGFTSIVWSALGFSKAFPTAKVRLLAASFCFWIPVYRDVLLGCGFIDASRVSCERAITLGHSIAVCPGGASEALVSGADADRLLLNHRRGFVKLALKNGLSLVPVFSFNEGNAWNCVKAEDLRPRWIAKAARSVQICFQGAFGWSVPLVCSLIPKQSKVTVVFGSPIQVVQKVEPSEADIEALFDLYRARLVELHAKYSPLYSEPGNKELVIL